MASFSGTQDFKGRIGEHLGYSDWLEVTQERVNAFAEATGDFQWIHVDVERAAKSPFGGTIAHGFLTLSLIPYFMAQGFAGGAEISLPTRMTINYGLNRVRYPLPVPVGARVRARRKLLAFDAVEPNVFQLTQQFTVEVEGRDKPAMVAEMLVRAYL